jgi:hypothetical protein
MRLHLQVQTVTQASSMQLEFPASLLPEQFCISPLLENVSNSYVDIFSDGCASGIGLPK